MSAQELQERLGRERQAFEANYQQLDEARAAIEREIGGARRDLAEVRADSRDNGQDQGRDQEAIERLAQRMEALAKLEQDNTLSRSPSQSQTQLSDADAMQAMEQARREKEDAELGRRWSEMDAQSEAALKENFRAVREQAERARQAVDAQTRDLDQRYARERQALADRQAQDIARQSQGDATMSAQELQERLGRERQAFEANYQQQRAELDEARAAIEREIGGARRDLVEVRADSRDNGRDQGRDQEAIERLAQRMEALAKLEQDATSDINWNSASGPELTRKSGRQYMAADDDLDLERKRRIPKEQQARPDIEDLVPNSEEAAGEHPQRAALERTRKVIGVRIAENENLKSLWDKAANDTVNKYGGLNQENYAHLYDQARDHFWDAVRDDEQARKMLEHAGFAFDESRAPFLQIKDNSKVSENERRLTLDHVIEKRDRWDLALDADNLRFELQNPNSMREAIQQRDKALRKELQGRS
jgi:hypothetical protein